MPIVRQPSADTLEKAYLGGCCFLQAKLHREENGHYHCQRAAAGQCHLNRDTAQFYVKEVWGTPCGSMLTAMELASKAAGLLGDAGVELGGTMVFERAPEFAYPGHPAALEYARQGRPLGAKRLPHLWVDRSTGIPELETDDRWIAFRIEKNTVL